MKTAIITSTRADWGLLHPLVAELTRRGEKPIIIATYAHLFPEMGDTIQEMIDDGFPPTMTVPARREPDEAVADTVTGFTKAFRFLKPDKVVILGDRFEIAGVAMAATLRGIPIVHISGGTVSQGAVDDVVRNVISQMAEYHFPETDKGRRRLILMGADPRKTVTAGALGVYNALHAPQIDLQELEKYLDFELGFRYLLGTFHPETKDVEEGEEKTGRLSSVEQMKVWIEGLGRVMEEDKELKMLLTFPNTDTDPTPLISRLYTFQTSWPGRVKVVPSLGRVRYINAARYAAAVAGNSSSGIVEIPSVGTPVVNVGNRQRGRQCSKAVIHCPLEPSKIAAAIKEALTKDAKLIAETTPNPYYRPDTPSIISDKLLEE